MVNSRTRKNVLILGSTGSIGRNTLDVIRRHPARYKVFALTAHSSVEEMFAQCIEFTPNYAYLADASAAEVLNAKLLAANSTTVVLADEAEMLKLCSSDEVDHVMAAIVGAAGLRPTLAAAAAGKRVLLANKEALVMAGALFMRVVRESGAELLPIDSEHNAIFQCLSLVDAAAACKQGKSIQRILLTASGGPFRTFTMDALKQVSRAQALKHPTWSMGNKITIDSASMMNKGLEFIEACWLFSLDPQQIEIHVHPESIVHSMVEYCDGSILAQLGSPDMRTPIAYGLSYPDRIASGVTPINLFELGRLTFEAPDPARFPSITLARQAFEAGGAASVVLNAANEIAVEAFLAEKISFLAIPALVQEMLGSSCGVERLDLECVDAIIERDLLARCRAREMLSRFACC